MTNSKPQERPERNYQLHDPADFISRERDPGSQWTNNERAPKPIRRRCNKQIIPFRYENRTLFVQYRTKCKNQSDYRHAQCCCNSQPTALLHNPTVSCFIHIHAYICVNNDIIINSWKPVTTWLLLSAVDRIYGIRMCVLNYVSSFGTLKFSMQTAERFIQGYS